MLMLTLTLTDWAETREEGKVAPALVLVPTLLLGFKVDEAGEEAEQERRVRMQRGDGGS